MPSSNTGGYTKRVTATALVFLAYCVGNIVGPHAFLAKEAPVYETGCKLILACVLGQMACTIALRVLLIRRNKRRDAEGVVGPQGDADEQVLADLTDFEVCVLLVPAVQLLMVVEPSLSICFIGSDGTEWDLLFRNSSAFRK